MSNIQWDSEFLVGQEFEDRFRPIIAKHTSAHPFASQEALDKATVGSKNANLAALFQYGLPVPNGFAVPASVFTENVDRDALLKALRADDLERARRIAMNTEIPQEIFHTYDSMLQGSRVAVRSSALAEDASGKSMGGQLDSYNYQTRDGGDDMFPDSDNPNFKDWGIAKAIQLVWASYFSPRVMSYKEDKDDIAVAVVVQKQVDSVNAGGVFSANPASGRLDEHMIEVVPGHGENYVGGHLTPDVFVTDKETGKVKSIQGPHMILTPDDVQKLHAMGHTAEKAFGYPQDIEWAKDKDGDIYFVQSRDITAGLPEDTPRGPSIKEELLKPTRFKGK